MKLKELGKKYNIVILDDETIEDLEKDVERSTEALEAWVKRLGDLNELIQKYKQAVKITIAYSERVEKTSKVIDESRLDIK